MFCSNCGKELKDDAKFCDGCGAKVEKSTAKEEPVVKKESTIKEGKIFKCPFCGEILPYDAVKCPTCGHEIRGREVTSSIQSFFDKYSSLDDDEKKIELVKTFPIPNNREDILEFMMFASSNFDAKYYATNKRKDSLSSAWLSKIEQCYQKAEILFTDERDLANVKKIYDKAHGDTKKVTKTKLILILCGFVGIAVGLVGICTIGQANTAVGAVFIIILAAAIVALVFGFKRKKTNKEIAEEKAEKARKEELKNQPKVVEKKVVVHETKTVVVDKDEEEVDDEDDEDDDEEDDDDEDDNEDSGKKKKKHHAGRALLGAARIAGGVVNIVAHKKIVESKKKK